MSECSDYERDREQDKEDTLLFHNNKLCHLLLNGCPYCDLAREEASDPPSHKPSGGLT